MQLYGTLRSPVLVQLLCGCPRVWLCSDIALPCEGHVCHMCERVSLPDQMVGIWRNTVHGLTFLPCRWDVMLACWDTTQQNRPHFSQLTEMTSGIQLRADEEDVGGAT